MIDLDECLKRGLLRRITPSREKAFQSLEKAREFADEARDNFREARYNTATIMGYLAFFNAARSILFKDGYTERSHTCTIRYLEEKYAKEMPKHVIERMDRYRTQRHQTQYDVGYYTTKEDAKEIIDFTEEVIKLIERIVRK